jgi:hypothetical protein
MGKLNRGVTAARTGLGVITTTSAAPDTFNADGLPAYTRDSKSELFLMAVGAFYGEAKFYETASEASTRFSALVQTCTVADPAWTAAFLAWLRTDANIRTAAIVGAAEYVRAGGPNGRSVVKSVIRRADEPGEMLAYWTAKYGRRIPQPVKRGVRDAAQIQYNERNVAKWDSAKASFRFADVIELTHPAPLTPAKSGLYQYLLEERHGRGVLEGKGLTSLEARARALASDDPREALLAELEAGNPTVTWETVSSAGTGKLTAAQWERMVHGMGYMAVLRNLRNFDQADMALAVKRTIGQRLADPAEVAASKQLPMRFLSAYKAVQNDVWHSYLAEALDHSLANVPEVKGRWLVLVDASGSMGTAYSKDSSMTYYEAACVFASAFARRNDAQVRTYSSDGQISQIVPLVRGESTLQSVKRMLDRGSFWFGGGTDTSGALATAYRQGKYDHVLLITDEQYNGSWSAWYGRDKGAPGDMIPAQIPLYTANIAGYAAAQDASTPNRITVGGLSDSMFTMIASVESMRDGAWPWEA